MSGSVVTGLYNHPLVTACLIHTYLVYTQCDSRDYRHNNVVTAGGNNLKVNQEQQQEQQTKELSKQT